MKTISLNLLVIAISFSFLCFDVKGQTQNGDQIIGKYWTNNKEGKIEIFKKGRKYYGKILWRKEPVKDIKNPDKSLRNRNVIGIEFLKDFVFDGKNKWEGGTVYSFDNGGTYKGRLWLENQGEILKMRGFWGISLIGRTATLQKIR